MPLGGRIYAYPYPGQCGHACSYNELLAALDTPTGLATEVRHQRLTLLTMLGNMEAWLGRRVLSVSLPQFEADFDGTVRCIATFLGLSGARARSFVHAAAKHDLKRQGVESTSTGVSSPARVAQHVTRDRPERAALRETLIESGAFGPHLAEIDALLAALLADGSERYGCPLAPPTL